MPIASAVATAALSTVASEGVKSSGLVGKLMNSNNWPIITGLGVISSWYFTQKKKGNIAGIDNTTLKWGSFGLAALGVYLFIQSRKTV